MQLNGQRLTLSEIAAVAFGNDKVEISAAARSRVVASRKVIDEIIERDTVVYGVNTGFGKLGGRARSAKANCASSSSISFAVTLAASVSRFPSRKCAR